MRYMHDQPSIGQTARRGAQMRRLFLTLVLCLLTVVHAAEGQDAPSEGITDAPPWTVLEQRLGQGEQCLVCGEQIFDMDVVEIRYQGRVFHVSAMLLDQFEDNPDQYFAKLQSRSAFLDESSLSSRSLSWGWLIFGGYILLGLIFGAICGYKAITKALPPLKWFFAGFVGNIAALVVLSMTPDGDKKAFLGGIPKGLRKVPRTRQPVACPQCGSANHPTSQTCGGCDVALNPKIESEIQRV